MVFFVFCLSIFILLHIFTNLSINRQIFFIILQNSFQFISRSIIRKKKQQKKSSKLKLNPMKIFRCLFLIFLLFRSPLANEETQKGVHLTFSFLSKLKENIFFNSPKNQSLKIFFFSDSKLYHQLLIKEARCLERSVIL